MTSPQEFAEDVRYVRRLIDRPRLDATAIWWLWAVLGSVGFALVDLAPNAVPLFWAIAGPLGGIASAALGIRHGRLTGEQDRETGLRWAAHFAGLLALIALAVGAAAWEFFPFESLNGVIVLLIIAAYFTAGVHLDRRLIWVAGATAFTFPLVALLPSHGWTASGALVGLTLIGIAVLGRRRA